MGGIRNVCGKSLGKNEASAGSFETDREEIVWRSGLTSPSSGYLPQVRFCEYANESLGWIEVGELLDKFSHF